MFANLSLKLQFALIRQKPPIGKAHGPSFCLMKISQGVRGFAAQEGVDEQAALQKGMEQKVVGFVKQGAEAYHKA